MYNVVNKILIAAIAVASLSCSNTKEEEAKQLLQYAEACLESGNYSEALGSLDSLQHAYPSFIDIQRDAMHLRPKAIEGMTLEEMSVNDSIIATLEAEHNTMKDLFVSVNHPDLLEGYYVIKGLDKPIFDCTAIQPRLSVAGEFYIVSSLNGKPVKHTAISLSHGTETACTPNVNYDGERNYRSGNTEMITFMPAECDTLGNFAIRHDNTPLTLKFIGKQTHALQLKSSDTHAIALTCKMSRLLSDLKKARMKKELLEQQLLLARDHIARTFREPDAVKD